MEKKIEKIVKHAEVSEKAIERYLSDSVKELGGICLKYSNPGMAGYPDRICLLPGGVTIWVELKSKDGELKATYQMGDELSHTTDGGRHRYTVYFPHYAFPIVSEMELVGATIFEPCVRPAEILFFGDSITHGARSNHPSNTYVMRVARARGVCVLNQGNSGFVYDAGSVERVCDPKIVVCAYGINDIVRKKDKSILRGDAEDFHKRVRECYPSAKIVSILPIWTNWEANKIDCMVDDREILHSVYREYSDYIVDGRELIPLDMSLFDDGIHPTEAGFEHYGKNLAKRLSDALEKES